MSGRVRAYCNNGHEAVVETDSVRVKALKRGGVYIFTCPRCGVVSAKPCNDSNLLTLLTYGAHTGAWQDEEILP